MRVPIATLKSLAPDPILTSPSELIVILSWALVLIVRGVSPLVPSQLALVALALPKSSQGITYPFLGRVTAVVPLGGTLRAPVVSDRWSGSWSARRWPLRHGW